MTLVIDHLPVLVALIFCIAFSGLTAFAKSAPGDDLFNNPKVRTFKITIADDQYKALARENRKYVHATIVEGGITYSNIAIRLKGMGSFRPLQEKPCLAVKFDEYVPHQRFCGLSKVMLNNAAQDASYLAEYVGTSLFRDAGLPVARVTHGFVELNGKDLGLYVIVEAVNKDFLRRHFKNANGNLYEAYLQDIDQPLDLDNGVDNKQTDVKALVAACQIPDPAQRWSHLHRLMDVDGFITHTVLEMFTSHTDGYALNRNNYRLYHDPTTDRFVFITHGIDWAFGNTGVGIRPPLNSIVVRAVLGTPDGRRIYRERLEVLYTNLFRVDVLTNRVHEAVARLKAAARNPGEAKEFENCGASMGNLIVARYQNVTQQLFAPEPEPLKFDNTGYARVSGWNTKIDSGNPQLERRTEGSQRILYINGDNGIREISVDVRVSSARLFAVVVCGCLLSADQSRLGLAGRASAEVGEFFGAHVALAPQTRYNNGPLQRQFLSLLIAERNGPASQLVEAFQRINEMTVKCVAPRLAVSDHIDAGTLLECYCLVDCLILYWFEFPIADLTRFVTLSRLF